MEHSMQPLQKAPAAPVRIFVVDDDADLRTGLSRMLRAAGWEVETFASGSAFLQRAPWMDNGCLLLDVHMPDMSGPQLCEALELRGHPLPVVFLTGHGDVAVGVQAMKRGAVDYLLKPPDPELLLDTVADAVARNAAHVEQRQALMETQDRLARLSPREREVMEHVIVGRLNKQIADRMEISLKTVKAHRARVMTKMEARSVAVLVHLCERAGMGLQNAPMPAPRRIPSGPIAFQR